jgi:PII interaction protein X
MNSESPETYINHPTWGLLYRICLVDESQELFTTLYAQRLFFIVTAEGKNMKFQPIGRTEARMMLETRLRNLRRSGPSFEYDQLQGVFQRTFN